MGRAKVRYGRERIASVINDAQRIAASAIAANAGVRGNNREATTTTAAGLRKPQQAGIGLIPTDHVGINWRIAHVQVGFVYGIVGQVERVRRGAVAGERRRGVNWQPW